MQALKKICSFVRDLIYPSFCLHCQEDLPSEQKTLCRNCLPELILLLPQRRCLYCFCLLEEGRITKSICEKCMQKGSLFHRRAAAFYYGGPASALVQQMKYSRRPDLAKVLGAYLAMQMMQLRWDGIDVIIPVPQSFLRRMQRGYNQSLLLAQTLGKILNLPVKDILRKRQTGYPQAALSQSQRQLHGAQVSIYATKTWDGSDQNILLIDDVTTTGTTLNRCAEALTELCPSKIFALTVCQTDD